MKKLIFSIYVVLSIFFGGNMASADSVKILDAWVRPAPKDKNSALYLKIVNDTSNDIMLTAAESSAARKIELHNTTDANGIMKMHQIPQIPCPAELTTELKPGGMHIMLIGLKQDLKLGDTVPINLRFSDGLNIMLDAPVKKGPECCSCHAS